MQRYILYSDKAFVIDVSTIEWKDGERTFSFSLGSKIQKERKKRAIGDCGRREGVRRCSPVVSESKIPAPFGVPEELEEGRLLLSSLVVFLFFQDLALPKGLFFPFPFLPPLNARAQKRTFLGSLKRREIEKRGEFEPPPLLEEPRTAYSSTRCRRLITFTLPPLISPPTMSKVVGWYKHSNTFSLPPHHPPVSCFPFGKERKKVLVDVLEEMTFPVENMIPYGGAMLVGWRGWDVQY